MSLFHRQPNETEGSPGLFSQCYSMEFPPLWTVIFDKGFDAAMPWMEGIGGHLVWYPWSAISDWAWYRNFRYRTERVESNIISDVGINFYPISNIRHLKASRQNQQLSVTVLAYHFQGHGFESATGILFFSSILDIRMSSDVDIGTLPISEWRFSVRHICLRYRNNRCRCRISPKLRSMSMPTYDGGQGDNGDSHPGEAH